MRTLIRSRAVPAMPTRPAALTSFSLLIAALLWPGPGAQAQQISIHRMSAAQLLEGLRGETAIGQADSEHNRQMAHERAAAYVAGVADATDGSRWCLEGGIKLHELTDRVATRLTSLPPEALTQNAAVHVMEALSARFPCTQR